MYVGHHYLMITRKHSANNMGKIRNKTSLCYGLCAENDIIVMFIV